jgi:predicted naringenin-chalcone synthase
MVNPAILGLATAVPPHRFEQAAIGTWMRAEFADDPALARWLGLLYAGGGIQYRHSVLPELVAPVGLNRWSPARAPAVSPTTAERLRLYRQQAPGLALAAARPLVERLDEVAAQHRQGPQMASGRRAITHLIAISCTGLYAPGLDLDLAIGLDLQPDVRRTLVGFMGCAAGITGLRLAAETVKGDPEALVLVVALELCSLHLQPSREREALISASLFGDGAGAALVGRSRPGMPGLFGLTGFATHLVPETAAEMVWTIGDHGFALRLSPRVPERVATAAPGLIEGLLGERPAFWAIHPGGKGILDRLERTCRLAPEALEPSRWVLRERGNLSSATIFHVLERWADRLGAPAPGIAAAFGPGLVTELAALQWLGAPTSLGTREAERHGLA